MTPTRLQLLPPMAKVMLRGRGGAMLRLGDAVGLSLPTAPLTSIIDGERSVLWLGPDTWLLLGGDVEAPTPMVVDVGDALHGFVLEGPASRDVLAAGCRLDLHPRALPVGFASRTLLAKAEVILHRRPDVSDAPVFWLFVGRSFAAYVQAWLQHAGREVGLVEGA